MRQMFLVLVLMCIASPSFADENHAARCEADKLTSEAAARGRNAWARKCGYQRQSMENASNEDGVYIVFTKGKHGGTPNIPISESDSCISGLSRLGYCQVGCYLGSQHLLLGGQPVAIESAFARSIKEVETLSQTTRRGELQFEPRAIQHYTSGETEENIYTIQMENGSELQVTADHPFVGSDFVMVKAKDLKKGHSLVHRTGELVPIRSISIDLYKGKVWNVQPESKVRAENILVAEGFLTGSIRFQNQWADDFYRLSLRDDI